MLLCESEDYGDNCGDAPLLPEEWTAYDWGLEWIIFTSPDALWIVSTEATRDIDRTDETSAGSASAEEVTGRAGAGSNESDGEGNASGDDDQPNPPLCLKLSRTEPVCWIANEHACVVKDARGEREATRNATALPESISGKLRSYKTVQQMKESGSLPDGACRYGCFTIFPRCKSSYYELIVSVDPSVINPESEKHNLKLMEEEWSPIYACQMCPISSWVGEDNVITEWRDGQVVERTYKDRISSRSNGGALV